MKQIHRMQSKRLRDSMRELGKCTLLSDTRAALLETSACPADSKITLEGAEDKRGRAIDVLLAPGAELILGERALVRNIKVHGRLKVGAGSVVDGAHGMAALHAAPYINGEIGSESVFCSTHVVKYSGVPTIRHITLGIGDDSLVLIGGGGDYVFTDLVIGSHCILAASGVAIPWNTRLGDNAIVVLSPVGITKAAWPIPPLPRARTVPSTPVQLVRVGTVTVGEGAKFIWSPGHKIGTERIHIGHHSNVFSHQPRVSYRRSVFAGSSEVLTAPYTEGPISYISRIWE